MSPLNHQSGHQLFQIIIGSKLDFKFAAVFILM